MYRSVISSEGISNFSLPYDLNGEIGGTITRTFTGGLRFSDTAVSAHYHSLRADAQVSFRTVYAISEALRSLSLWTIPLDPAQQELTSQTLRANIITLSDVTTQLVVRRKVVVSRS